MANVTEINFDRKFELIEASLYPRPLPDGLFWKFYDFKLIGVCYRNENSNDVADELYKILYYFGYLKDVNSQQCEIDRLRSLN
jgi:hypothetical protein